MSKKKYFLPVDTQNLADLSGGNLYKSLMIVAKRANQITHEQKLEISKRLEEFTTSYDTLDEVMENKEQIEISRAYERRPKTTQVALEEFQEGGTFWRDPNLEVPEA